MSDIVRESVFTLGNQGSQAEVAGTHGASSSHMHEAACQAPLQRMLPNHLTANTLTIASLALYRRMDGVAYTGTGCRYLTRSQRRMS